MTSTGDLRDGGESHGVHFFKFLHLFGNQVGDIGPGPGVVEHHANRPAKKLARRLAVLIRDQTQHPLVSGLEKPGLLQDQGIDRRVCA